MLDPDPLGYRLPGEPDPDDVTLGYMPGAFTVIDKVVYSPFQDRLILLLHGLARHLHQDGEGIRPARLHVLNLRSDNPYKAVLHFAFRPDLQEFKCRGPPSSELYLHLLLPDTLSLKRRRTGHGDGDRGDRDFDTPEFHSPANGLFRSDRDK